MRLGERVLHFPLLAASLALLTLHICGDGVEEGVETLAGEFLLLLTVLVVAEEGRAGVACLTTGLGLLPQPNK